MPDEFGGVEIGDEFGGVAVEDEPNLPAPIYGDDSGIPTNMDPRQRRGLEIASQLAGAQGASGTSSAEAEDLSSQERNIKFFANLPAEILNQPTRIADRLSRMTGGPAVTDIFETGKPILKFEPAHTGPSFQAGAEKLLTDTLSGFTTPEMILAAPAAVASKAVRALFGATIAQQLPEQVENAAQVLGDIKSTPAEKAVAVGNPAVASALALLLSKDHAPSRLIAPGELQAAEMRQRAADEANRLSLPQRDVPPPLEKAIEPPIATEVSPPTANDTLPPESAVSQSPDATGLGAGAATTPAVEPLKVTAPAANKSAAQRKAGAAQFTVRLKEYGEQLGFILRPDDVHGWTGGSSKSGQSGASVKGKVAHDKEMAAAKRRAIKDLGGDVDKPDFATLNSELEKRIAVHEEQQSGGGVHTELTGNESTEFLPEETPTVPKPQRLAESMSGDVSQSTLREQFAAGRAFAEDNSKGMRWLDPGFQTLQVSAANKFNRLLGLRVKGGYYRTVLDAKNAAFWRGVTERLGEISAEQSGPEFPETKEAAPAQPPKLGTSEKGTGDLFKGEDQPFNLAGEKGVDTERVATERAAAEQRAAEARAAQEKQQPGLPLDVESVPPQPKAQGIAGSVRAKWASATDSPLGGEGGFITLGPIEDFLASVTKGVKGVGVGVKNAFDATRAAARDNFKLAKTSDYRRAILHWSAKQQRSFSEAAQAQRELQQVIKDPIRRDAATNWIQAGGDAAVLRQRLAATQAWRDPVTGKPHPEAKRLIAGYEAALHLTPEEIAAATDAKNAYDALGARGAAHDVLKTFKDNYVTQVWDLKQGPTGGNKGMGFGARTLKERFRFSKASTFRTYFDGEQAGFVPKTKDISNLLPMYLHEMNNVIAARQLVQQLSKGVASDGKPLIAPRGAGVTVDDAAGKATLIMPDAMKADTEGYVRMENQPALHDWRWQTKDSDGNPVFMKSDLVIHPDAADHFKNVLGKSAIQEWYQSKTSAGAEIPKAIMKSIDQVQSETKRTMLGLLAPFHQVQEGTHAIGHRVNPFFNNPTINLVHDAAQMDAARHGLMLQPDRVSAQQFMEGFRHSGLVSKIPGLGPLADHYSNYLFHEYIPGIKFKTYEAIVARNLKVFEKDLSAGKVTREDVKILSAEQANAAYGHLNYADLGRNPTIQHLMRLGLLAPDFLEARARFAGQAIKGAGGGKVGREQLVALATLAVAQATLSYVSAKLTGGQWDAKDPFAFHVGNKKFTMRSVPEDLVRFATDTRAFTYARLSPIIGRGAVQYMTGVDWRGKKVTAAETTKELLKQPIPLTLRPLLGVGNTALSGWEELAGAVGLKISRYSNVAEVSKKAHQWMDKSPDPRIRAAEQQNKQETLPDSLYKPLREALMKDDRNAARAELKKLLEIRKPAEIGRAMHAERPFTGSLQNERQFKASLSPDDLRQYEAARAEQRALYQKFLQLKK